jgi:hypothetical protein
LRKWADWLGHAYNALAIVYAAERQELKAAYHFIRAFTTRRPFRHIDTTIYNRADKRVIKDKMVRPKDNIRPVARDSRSVLPVIDYLDAMAWIQIQKR